MKAENMEEGMMKVEPKYIQGHQNVCTVFHVILQQLCNRAVAAFQVNKTQMVKEKKERRSR